jgi:hypothetical protein
LGHPVSRGYKYGDLVLQVGGWSTGLETSTIVKLLRPMFLWERRGLVVVVVVVVVVAVVVVVVVVVVVAAAAAAAAAATARKGV